MRCVAWFFYTFGMVVAVGVFTNGARLFVEAGNPIPAIMGLGLALAAWWLTVGIGVRLGMTPLQFARDVRKVLGFTKDWRTSKTSN